ncbi:substrate-binding domain-containing protein [Spirochaeta dissipatitropha]
MKPCIALYVNNLDEEYQLSVFQGAREAALESGLNLLCVQGEALNDYDPKRSEIFPSRGIFSFDAAILLSSAIYDHGDITSVPGINEAFSSIPCLSMGTHASMMPSIVIPCEDSMKQLLDHLIDDHRYRRFLFLGGPEKHSDSTARRRVFTDCMQSRSKQYPDMKWEYRSGGFSETSGFVIVKRYINEHPDHPLDAVVAANDNMAIGAMKAIQSADEESGWRACAVTGYDDIPHAALEIPSLSTIRQPLQRMGRAGVEVIVRMLEGVQVDHELSVPSELCLRESCGCRYERGNLSQQNTGVSGSQLYEVQTEKFRIEQAMRSLSYLGQRLSAVYTMEELVFYLGDFLQSIGVEAYYLLVYSQPCHELPYEAELVYCVEDGKEYSFLEQPQLLQPEEIARRTGLYEDNPQVRCVYHLQSGHELLGMVIYSTDDYSHTQICSSSVSIANTLKRFHLFADEKMRAQKLEEQVELRTRDLRKLNMELETEARRRLAVEAQVLQISEMERLRFSMDLHDDICQRLCGISMLAKSIKKLEDASELVEMIDETLVLTRRYAHDSFPMELSRFGLRESLQQLCSAARSYTGCDISMLWEAPNVFPMTHEQQLNVYRIVQEALQNAIKHGKPSRIVVAMQANPEDTVLLEVSDNGSGMVVVSNDQDAEQKLHRRPRGLGLRSMQYRAHQLQAEYRIQSSPGEGTCIQLYIPLGKVGNSLI